jgi:Zn-finger nucleic acid-binding protein
MADQKQEPPPENVLNPEGKRPCPVCGSIMTTETRNKVSIDGCAQHGIWLDRGELEKIVSGVKIASRRKGRIARKDAKTRGRYEGIFFGWMALMWD